VGPPQSSDTKARRAARDQWDRNPAGVTHADAAEGSAEFFAQMTTTRYQLQPWMPEMFLLMPAAGRVLEIGCGAGTDLSRLATTADTVVGVDLAPRGASLTNTRLRLEGRSGGALLSDAECLALPDGSFDSVYSFGVIHHTDHPDRAIHEIARVLRPGGQVLVALYHRWSLTTLGILLHYTLSGAIVRRPWATHLSTVEYGHDQAEAPPVVRLYSRRQASKLFPTTLFRDVRVTFWHSTFKGRMFRGRLARPFGWYVVVNATRR